MICDRRDDTTFGLEFSGRQMSTRERAGGVGAGQHQCSRNQAFFPFTSIAKRKPRKSQ